MATAKKAARKAPVAKKASSTPTPMKPINTALNRSRLVAHLAEAAATEPKTARAVMAALEATILASVHKKGLGSFTLPGLLKVNVINVPAKKKRRGSILWMRRRSKCLHQPAWMRPSSRYCAARSATATVCRFAGSCDKRPRESFSLERETGVSILLERKLRFPFWSKTTPEVVFILCTNTRRSCWRPSWTRASVPSS